MKLIKTIFSDSFLINNFVSTDLRGCFIKDYSMEFLKSFGIFFNLKECFYTISRKGTIRANHFQIVKEQGKLIRVIKGKIFDVIVDLRKDSKTFKKWQGFILDDKKCQSLYVPRGFSHGYYVLEKSIVSYKCDEKFYPEYDSGILWNDKTLNIKWPINEHSKLIISKKDKNLQTFKEYIKNI